MTEAAIELPAIPVPQARTPGWTEYAGIVAFFALIAWILQRVAVAEFSAPVWMLAIAGVIGFVGSDFTSGFVHWLFDTWGSTTTPVVGKTFIEPFRIHHSDQKDITRHGFVATNGHNCLVAVPVLAMAFILPASTTWGSLALIALVSLCLGVFATNQFHKWAHEDDVGPVIDFLQRTGIILGREHHSKHHNAPYDRNYCITTGWLNPVLGRIRFFQRVERLITAVTGVQPRVDDLKDVKA